MGRKAPGSRCGADVIDVTGEIDLWEKPLDLKNSFRAHAAIVEVEKSFVNSNGLFARALSAFTPAGLSSSASCGNEMSKVKISPRFSCRRFASSRSRTPAVK